MVVAYRRQDEDHLLFFKKKQQMKCAVRGKNIFSLIARKFALFPIFELSIRKHREQGIHIYIYVSHCT